jgi:3-hydroxyacyl-CoA dehydrogenase
MTDNQEATLTHVIQAEQEASNIPGLPSGTATRPINRVGVVGAGTMGGGIAMNFANVGIPVVIVEAKQEALDRGLGLVNRNYETSASRGRITAEDVATRMALLTGSLDYAALADCDIVIEAVFEDMTLKQSVLAQLGAVLKHEAIIATNTSTLDVDILAEATGRPEVVVGTHFFSPANVMRLLEVVRGAKTAPDVLATVVALASTIGKIPVVSGVCYGFIGNRMAEAYMREMEFLLMEGATPAQIDGAVQALGMAMGPCRMLDMAGIDVGARTIIEWKKSGMGPSDPAYRAVVDHLFAIGRHGQKTGLGYYRYNGRDPEPDADLSTITRKIGDTHGIAERTAISDQEIVERLLYPLINEGCRILEEGIAYRPGDIDVVWTSGYGFPKALGGPMYWAETIGLAEVLARIEHYGVERGNSHGYWTPSALLQRAAKEGIGLAQACLTPAS